MDNVQTEKQNGQTVTEERRLQQEAELYQQWRSIFDNEIRENDERHRLLEEESNKYERILSERQELIDDEIRNIQLFHETNVNELKNQDQINENLLKEVNYLFQIKYTLGKELENIEINSIKRQERMNIPHNTGRVKMLLVNRSSLMIQEMKDDIAVLSRIGFIEQIALLKEKFEKQCKIEIQRQSQMEPMYESEATALLERQEKIWIEESLEREQLIKILIAKELESIEEKIVSVTDKQHELIGMKQKHLAAIEEINKKFKHLLDHKYFIGVSENHAVTDEEADSGKLDHLEQPTRKSDIGYHCDKHLLSPKFGKKWHRFD